MAERLFLVLMMASVGTDTSAMCADTSKAAMRIWKHARGAEKRLVRAQRRLWLLQALAWATVVGAVIALAMTLAVRLRTPRVRTVPLPPMPTTEPASEVPAARPSP